MATIRFNYLQHFRIALRKIGYTKAEANKIVFKIRKNKDNYGCFELACEGEYTFADMLIGAFIWCMSPEDHNYWKTLYMQLRTWEEYGNSTF